MCKDGEQRTDDPLEQALLSMVKSSEFVKSIERIKVSSNCNRDFNIGHPAGDSRHLWIDYETTTPKEHHSRKGEKYMSEMASQQRID